jgi:hypothetical protein
MLAGCKHQPFQAEAMSASGLFLIGAPWQTLSNSPKWIALSDTVASCTYRFCWKAGIDGKTFEGTGRGTMVLRSESSRWKIIHEHLSRFPN